MKNFIGQLKDLEKIYKTKFDLQEKRFNIPKYLNAKEEKISSLKEFLDYNESEYESFKAQETSLKIQIQDIFDKKAKAEQKIDSVKTQREYEALERELQDIVDEEVNLRKNLSHVMGAKNKIEKELEKSKEELKELNEELSLERVDLESKLVELDESLKKIESEESNFKNILDDDFIFKFERIIKSKSNGVVPVIDNVCRGCYMILPLEFANEVRRAQDEIKFCPYCSRILYYEQGDGATGEIVPGGLAELLED